MRIEPCIINGVTVSYVTGHNAKYILNNNIHVGAKIKITRSGDVIPKIIDVLESDKNKVKLPDMKWEWNDTKVDIISTEHNDLAEIKRIYNFFEKLGVAFTGEFQFLFKDYFNLKNNFPYVINNVDLDKFDTIFHLTLEIQSLINQKYSRSDICSEIISFFKIKDIKSKIVQNDKNYKIKKISIFPLSNSPIRTMPIEILIKLINLLKKHFNIEKFLNRKLEISNLLYKRLIDEKINIIDPKNTKALISAIKKIEYGIFMDSGPLHVAKMFNKKGLLIETSVSSKMLLRNYKMIKGIENSFSSSFCIAPCGLTDIFNHNNNHGCFDSLQIERAKFKRDDYSNMISRGVKNHYKKFFFKPVGCLSSLNVQNIYNAIMKETSLCEES